MGLQHKTFEEWRADNPLDALEESCPRCEGDGTVECAACHGEGALDDSDDVQADVVECPECEGEGALTCPECAGDYARALYRRDCAQTEQAYRRWLGLPAAATEAQDVQHAQEIARFVRATRAPG